MDRTQAEAWARELYRAVLGRAPDTNGLEYWTNALVGGLYDKSTSYYAFLRTGEGQRNIGQRVDQAYQDVFGREADAAGRAYWINRISSGKAPSDLSSLKQLFQTYPEYEAIQRGGVGSDGGGIGDGVNTLGGGEGGGVGSFDTPTRNVSAEIGMILERYGLGSLTDWAVGLLKNGEVTDAEFIIRLYDRDEFKQRFPAIEAAQAKGMAPLSPEEYMAYEQSAVGIMRAAGLPSGFYDSTSDFTELIIEGVSPSELAARVDQGFSRVQMAGPEVRARFAEMFGVQGDQALAALFLDPDKALPALERQVITAEIAGFGDVYGIGLDQTQAELLAELGYEGRTATSGFRNIQENQSLFTESVSETEDFTAEEEGVGAAFGTDADASRNLERRARSRTGALSGGGGFLLDESGLGGRADS